MSDLYSPNETEPSRSSLERAKGARAFRTSAIVHVVLLILIVAASYVTFKPPEKKSVDILTDFTVAVPPAEEEKKDGEALPPEPEKPPEPPAPEEKKDEEPLPVPEKPKPKPKPKKAPIQVSRKIVTKKPETTRQIVKSPSSIKNPDIKRSIDAKGPKLTDDEIRKLLAQGARPAETTSIPATETERCLTLIRDQLYSAWVRPDASNIAPRAPVIEISIGPGGVVRQVRLKSSSGNPVLDQSALSAARAIPSFRNLTERFIRANPTVTVNFQLKG